MNQTSQRLSTAVKTANDAALPSKVAVIAASWHDEIVSACTQSIQAEFERRRMPSTSLEIYRVPGAFELPLHAMRLARTERYDAIIACGLVVNGGIYRHEFVAAAVIDGIMRVQLDTNVPIFSAVLTPRDFHEHEEHHQFFKGHFVKKGAEIASACLETIASLRSLGDA